FLVDVLASPRISSWMSWRHLVDVLASPPHLAFPRGCPGVTADSPAAGTISPAHYHPIVRVRLCARNVHRCAAGTRILRPVRKNQSECLLMLRLQCIPLPGNTARA